MGMYRFGNANLAQASVSPDQWTNRVYKDACKNGQCRMKTAKSVIAKYSPDKYLLSHCTIIASVDVDLADPKKANSDYLIHPEFSKFVNNNGDAWTKGVLKNSYKTFVGGENYLEHVQIPELSKGKIIDAVPREIVIGKDKEGKELTTHYIDILVATDRKHNDLIRKIEANELNSLSMGCLIKFSICSKCGNKAVDETQACEHVRYQKNNMFFDDNGVQRKIAELCGHESEPDSVKFIEASWVRQPAFTGAVLRSFVEPSQEIMAKLETACKTQPYKSKPGDYLKAAMDKGLIADSKDAFDPGPPEPKEDAPAEEPPAEEPEPKEPAKGKKDKGGDKPPPPPPPDAPAEEAPAEEAPAEEAPAEEAPAEAPAEEEAAPEAESDIKVFKKDLKKNILKQVQDDVLKELSDDNIGQSRAPDTLDETLIRPASLVMSKVWGAQKTWDRFINQKMAKSLNKKSYDKLRYGVHIAMTNNDLTVLKDYGYGKRDFLAVLSFIDGCFKKTLPLQVKKTIASLGGTNGKQPVELLQRVVSDLGRKVTRDEAVKICSWLRLMDFYS